MTNLLLAVSSASRRRSAMLARRLLASSRSGAISTAPASMPSIRSNAFRAISTTLATASPLLDPPTTNTIAKRFSHDGMQSLGDPSRLTQESQAQPWQAENNVDVQRVTRQALIYELAQQSSGTLERVVPWFFDNMPKSYFKQVPDHMRLDHIKAIAAVFASPHLGRSQTADTMHTATHWDSANLHLNLKTPLPDGRIVWTFIRPGTKPGTLLGMIEEQKHLDMTASAGSAEPHPLDLHGKFQPNLKQRSYAAAVSAQDSTAGAFANTKLPLSRLLVFSSKDESVSLNMFVYGRKTLTKHQQSPAATTTAAADAPRTSALTERPMTREQSIQSIISHAQEHVQSGKLEGSPHNLSSSPLFEPEALREYMETSCSDNYISIGQKVPRRFLRQRLMVDKVSGTEGTEVHIEPGTIHGFDLLSEDVATDESYYWVDVAVANSLPQIALEHTCRLLYMHQFDVSRARLDIIQDGENGSITMLRLLVRPIEGGRAALEEISNKLVGTSISEPGDIGMDAATSNLLVNNDDEGGDIAGEVCRIAGVRQSEKLFPLLAQEMKRIKWLDPSTINLVFDSHMRYHNASSNPKTTANPKGVVGVVQGEIITAMASLMHPILARDGGDALRYSKASILQTLSKPRLLPWAIQIANLFLERFNPKNPLSDDAQLQRRIDQLKQDISKNVEDSLAVELLHKMMDIVTHTLKTNVYMENRYGLGVRLDPALMASHKEELPYGIFFVHGRRFNGYHVRFRDISRGGMRLVTPSSSEQLALESARQFDECYGLAFAQQLKNKDIPEGGSKAVCLIDTVDLANATNDTEDARNFAVRKSVKAFTDTILDLVVSTDETKSTIVDYWGQPEVLYLGPDEQVIPEDINWIISRAAEREYPTPPAFMSSKPKAGINHKEYGVTSEGVNVYLDVALRETLNINPDEDTFTIKMTGGPDGDVGGNEIKILAREYGDRCKIVGVADHSGCAEDPNGLDQDELVRLVDSSLPIVHFDLSKLSADPASIVHDVQDSEEAVKARNTMHNRLVADAFVPCGGRPNTIDKTNYKNFLLSEGVGDNLATPSSRLIVEGANLFVTNEARQALWDEAGVSIVKDSSANKGGVITSSYEICAAMLIPDQDDFFANKDAIVSEVLAKLRGLAKLEAELLFREQKAYGNTVALPKISQIISNSINTATDALTEALDALSDSERNDLLPLFRAHLPPTMADMSFDKVHERVPAQYIKNAIASCLASKLVYKEGTKFVDSQPREQLAQMALKYIQKEREIAVLMKSIEEDAPNMPDDEKQHILRLLEAGGARTALNF